MGRPSFDPEPRRAEVSQWIQQSVPIEEMARRVGISPKTFRKHFPEAVFPDRVETVFTAPPYEPAPEDRLVVMVMAAYKAPHDQIAAALHITPEQLAFALGKELRDGSAMVLRETCMSLFDQTKARNVSATKASYSLVTREETDVASQPAAVGLTGKKEQQAANAQRVIQAGSRFAPPAPPKIVVNNG